MPKINRNGHFIVFLKTFGISDFEITDRDIALKKIAERITALGEAGDCSNIGMWSTFWDIQMSYGSSGEGLFACNGLTVRGVVNDHNRHAALTASLSNRRVEFWFGTQKDKKISFTVDGLRGTHANLSGLAFFGSPGMAHISDTEDELAIMQKILGKRVFRKLMEESPSFAFLDAYIDLYRKHVQCVHGGDSSRILKKRIAEAAMGLISRAVVR